MFKDLRKRLEIEKQIVLLNLKTVFFLIIPSFINACPAKNIVYYFSKPVKETQVMDLMFQIIPEYNRKNLHDIPQIILWVSIFIICILSPILFPKFHKNKIYAVRNLLSFFYLLNLIFFMRAVIMTLTILPDPSLDCRSQVGNYQGPQTMFGKYFYSFS
jgi:hypothetical protein